MLNNLALQLKQEQVDAAGKLQAAVSEAKATTEANLNAEHQVQLQGVCAQHEATMAASVSEIESKLFEKEAETARAQRELQDLLVKHEQLQTQHETELQAAVTFILALHLTLRDPRRL